MIKNPKPIKDLWKDPVFEVGQKVRCRYNSGYHFLTEGKIYTVVDYTPRNPTPTFTFPAYVGVIGDDGRRYGCHASRFEDATDET
jgi:hypothetical protein